MRTLLSVFYGEGERRIAELYHRSASGYEVDLKEDGEIVEMRCLYDHSRQYAEDCAENWIEGIIK